jgi:leader peptidase (prepilin peptidase)/N-methyltransferase
MMLDFDLLIQCYVFFIGACIGSFLNVCIYRVPEKLSIIRPGSSCPQCQTPIPFYLNIPVFSYILLKGKCRYCNARISIRYLAVELITAAFGLLLFSRFSVTPAFFFWFVFVSTLIVISFIDLDHQIIPDIISLPGIILFSSSFILCLR